MGYTTSFYGCVKVDPPLNGHEVDYLMRFATSRRMQRTKGPYYANPGSDFGQNADTEDVTNHNEPPIGQPGLWCQWVPADEGRVIEWDQGEKFYEAEDWMRYLIEHFLRPGAAATYAVEADAAFEHFTFDHVLNGVIQAEGEESGDLWLLEVADNVVTTKQGRVVYE